MTDETTLVQLRGLRKENAMFIETLQTFSRQQVQLFERLGRIENGISEMQRDITAMRSEQKF